MQQFYQIRTRNSFFLFAQLNEFPQMIAHGKSFCEATDAHLIRTFYRANKIFPSQICFAICYHMCSHERQFASSFCQRNIEIMKELIKVFVLMITIGPALCRQCEEDLIGFRKLGMHRKSSSQQWKAKLKFKAASAFNYAIPVLFLFKTQPM